MSQDTRQIRKAQNLSNQMHRDLSRYALAAGAAGVSALALVQPADGQIVYTPAHVELTPGGTMPVDLNHDGVTDFTIRQYLYRTGHSSNRLEAVPSPHGGIKKGVADLLAAAMLPGSNVGDSDAFVHGAAIMASLSAYSSAAYGSWLTAKNCYLGVKFHIDGDTHYGWARLTVTYAGPYEQDLALLTGYAYQTQANTSIVAGDEGNGGDSSAPNGPSAPEATANGTLGALALGSSSYCPFAGKP
jgi:hypothetical protein